MKNKNKLMSIGVFALAASLIVPTSIGAEGLGIGLNLGVEATNELKAEKKSNRFDINSNSEVNQELDINMDDYKENENLPEGIRKSPGIEKRVEEDRGFPKGILKFFTGFFTGDEDDDDDSEVVEIKLSNLDIEAEVSTAKIEFETNIETEGVLRYSKDSDLEDSSEVDIDLSEEHSVLIEDLESDTKYYFRIELETGDGEMDYESDIEDFKTKELDDESPELSFLHLFSIGSDNASIIWITTEKSDAEIWFSTDSEVDTTVDANISDSDLSLFHAHELVNLEADTEYYVKVSSTDEQGNSSISEALSFTTDTE